ncbi:uncharacterized protein LOC142728935 isoform X1 [Rhinoderma darwinii]|uniref:uncharacterized protein LOC142728935 isoform X1 n=1 Tax=Rhinoderma darwinii TaxID=43563 RepID=UPI003F66E7BE
MLQDLHIIITGSAGKFTAGKQSFYGYGDLFSETWKAFTDYEVTHLKAYDSKRDAVFALLPRMRYGLFYNTPLEENIRVTILIRSTEFPKILNLDELVHALKSLWWITNIGIIVRMRGVTWTWLDFEEFTTSHGRKQIKFSLRTRDITRLWENTQNSPITPSMLRNFSGWSALRQSTCLVILSGRSEEVVMNCNRKKKELPRRICPRFYFIT